MSDRDAKTPDDLHEMLRAIQVRVRRLTVAVLLMALAFFGLIAVMFGYLAEYHNFEAVLVGGAVVGAAILGFCVGLFAARKA